MVLDEPLSDEQRSFCLFLLQRANEFYQAQLRIHKTKSIAVDYLKNRGLSGVTANVFQIGYAPDGWQNLIDGLGSSTSKELLKQLGLASQSDKKQNHYYDFFRERIMFPIRNQNGDTVGFGGRIINDGQPKYLNSPETPVFHKSEELYGLFENQASIAKIKTAVLVEGYMDVVGLHNSGVCNGVATLGTSPKAEHFKLLAPLVETVVLCFDGDKAGKAAAWRALDVFCSKTDMDVQVRVLILPDGHDPDSLVSTIGADKFNELVNNAPIAAKYMTDSVFNDVFKSSIPDTISEDDSFTFYTELAELCSNSKSWFIDQIADSVEGLECFTDAKKYLTDSIAYVKEHPKRFQRIERPEFKDRRSPPEDINKLAKRSGIGVMTNMRRIISILLQKPQFAAALDLNGIDKNEPGFPVLSRLIKICRSNPTIDTAGLLNHFKNHSSHELLTRLSTHDHLLDDVKLMEMVDSCMVNLNLSQRDNRLQSLINKAKTSDLSHDERSEMSSLLQNAK